MFYDGIEKLKKWSQVTKEEKLSTYCVGIISLVFMDLALQVVTR